MLDMNTHSSSTAGVDFDTFREALSRLPAPVTVVTTMVDEKPHGTTCSSISSLSATPPLISVALNRESELLRLVVSSRRFGVNILGDGAEDVARRCAQKGPEKFAGVQWREEDGLPRILPEATWLSCNAHALVEGGDHLIVVGLVTRCDARQGGTYVYWRRTLIPLGEAIWRRRAAEQLYQEDDWLDDWPMGLR